MGYYCTVPQCTSLAGKTKNVKFHRFPRDVTMADKWNVILKRGKPYTKYSKVCSLHFTQSDYNVTTMGQWKTLSKDAVPSQNLPRLNPDGSVMIIRKSRTVKYREPGVKKEQESGSDKPQEKWAQSSSTLQNVLAPCHSPQHVHVSVGSNTAQRAEESNLAYRLQTINALANNLTSPSPALTASPQGNTTPQKTPKKQDAIMQTDPCSEEEENPLSTSFSDHSDNSFQSENVDYPNMSGSSHYQKEEYDSQVNRSSQMGQRETPGQTGLHQIQQDAQRSQSQNGQGQSQSGQTQGQNGPVQSHIGQRDGQMTDNYEIPKDYTKSNEDFNNALESANKYALERKYEKSMESGYQQKMQYNKVQDMYPSDYNRDFQEKQPDYNGRNEVYNGYQNGYADTVDILRNQQHNIQMLQEPHRLGEGPGLFDGHIKQETDLPHEDLYGQKEESDIYAEQRRQLMLQQRMLDQLQPHVKTEPDPLGGCDQSIPADSPYYQNGHNNIGMGYYEQFSRQPGPELLIAKQNALAAHTQIWQNSIRRPFFYSENVHSSGSQLLHRYEDLSRILQ